MPESIGKNREVIIETKPKDMINIIKMGKIELANKIKKGITKMEKDGHVLPRRNIHFMIDLIMEKELNTKNSKEVKKQ